jgi:mannose-6-phosphate isomerase-like protein (cupin superfamily)
MLAADLGASWTWLFEPGSQEKKMNIKTLITFALVATCLASTCSYAQQAARPRQPQAAAREDALDPTPIDPAVDPNIDMFINDWRNAPPRAMYGKRVFRDILTRLEGTDPVHPTRKGAVLIGITAISRATLDPGAVAAGKTQSGDRQVFYTASGTGQITVNAKFYDVHKGTGFTLTPDFDFKLTNTGKEPLIFYVRTEPLPGNYQASTDLLVVQRFENDRRVGAHWAHISNRGPDGMSLINIAPHTIPQPHSHAGEECWIMVEGETVLSLGKQIRRMSAGSAYKIPPTGITAHSNLNMGDEPVQMIFLGPAGAVRGAPNAQGAAPSAPDYARLDNSPFNRATEQDIDMFMGNWRDSFPRIMHGNLYVRDMLTALQGPDSLHPARKGAVLVNAEAVSYAMLEPGSSAHKIDGELKGIQQTFVVNSGTGVIASGDKQIALSKDKAFVITPGLDFKLTATGDKYLTFYVVSEKLPQGFTPNSTLAVIDNSSKPAVMKSWVNAERPLIAKDDGLSQYGALTQVEMKAMTMSRPYSAAQDVEEIWIATDADVNMLFGKQLRKLPAGTAYRVPSTGITAHANINTSDRVARFIYMVK